jgi:AcrR family transcriptional regulator
MTAATAQPARQTQSQRRARSRSALLEAAARGLSRQGYGNLVLERVAADAGYTRGALYHLFAGKEELALAVLEWVEQTWYQEVGQATAGDSPAEALVALARGHAVFCRRDIARVMMTLRVEFAGQDHPVGRAVEASVARLVAVCTKLITAARRRGELPPGAPPKVLALAYLGAVEGVVISLAGQAPHDERLAAAVARGVLGLPGAATSRAAST